MRIVADLERGAHHIYLARVDFVARTSSSVQYVARGLEVWTVERKESSHLVINERCAKKPYE